MGMCGSKLWHVMCCHEKQEHKKYQEETDLDHATAAKVAISGQRGDHHREDLQNACPGDDQSSKDHDNGQEDAQRIKDKKGSTSQKYKGERHTKHKRHNKFDSDSSSSDSDGHRPSSRSTTQVLEYAVGLQFGKHNKQVINNYSIQSVPQSSSTMPKKTEQKQNVSTSGGGAEMRATHGHDITTLNMSMRLEAARSVGIIRGPSSYGTGFLVGDLQIMAPAHVIKDINANGKLNSTLSIQFHYQHANDTDKIGSYFYFKESILYQNEHLDVVVLELMDNSARSNLPAPLNYFCRIMRNEKAYMYGHPKGSVSKEDPDIEVVHVDANKLESAKQWSLENFGENGYHGVQDENRVLFHCKFTHGASGSPGIYTMDYEEKSRVAWMFLKGYPTYFYEKNLPTQKKELLKDEYLIEQGVKMEAIWKVMSSENPDLCNKIFVNHNFSS